MNDNSRRYLIIPPNYQNGLTIFGMVTIGYINFIQGVLVGGLFLLLFIVSFVLKHSWNIGYIYGIIASFSAGFIPVAKGIKGGTFFQYIRNYFRFRSNRRVTVYNAHIKLENKPLDHDVPAAAALVYKDQLMIVWNKVKKKSIETEQKRVNNQVEAFKEYQDLYFEDDEDRIAKPEEYMTGKERRELKKEQKRKEKMERRKANEEKH